MPVSSGQKRALPVAALGASLFASLLVLASSQTPRPVVPVPESHQGSPQPPLKATRSVRELAPQDEPPPELPLWSLDLPADEGLTDSARDRIQEEAHELMRRTSPGDPRRGELLDRLTLREHHPRCGRAHSAALSGALTQESVEPELVARAVERADTGCDEVVLESAGFARNIDARLVAAIRRRVGSQADATTRAAWLAYGSIAETARSARADPSPLAQEIDAALSARLNVAGSVEEQLLFVRAAGNAGCVACRPSLAKIARSATPDLRRAAIAAHRFLDDESSVDLMCAALAREGDDRTRDLAAWSLEWRGTYGTKRARCLSAAAERDPSARVRVQSTLALGILADTITDATNALERLALRAADDRVAKLARGALVARMDAGADDDSLEEAAGISGPVRSP